MLESLPFKNKTDYQKSLRAESYFQIKIYKEIKEKGDGWSKASALQLYCNKFF